MDSFYEDSIFWSLYIVKSEHEDSLNRGFRKSYKYQIQFDMWFPTSKISKNLEKAENAKWKEVMLFHKNI